jgi:hypothetical protein
LAEQTGWLDSHPCLTDRLAAIGVSAKQAARLDLKSSGPPATALIEDWDLLEGRLTGLLMGQFHERFQFEQDMAQLESHLAKK